MKTSDNGINLIKKFEGIKTKAYKCPAGVWTIGYGHTSRIKSTDTCTMEQAIEYLKRDLIKFEYDINKLVKVELNQNQFDALISFVFNIGANAFENSTMLKFINNKHFPLATGQFDRCSSASSVNIAVNSFSLFIILNLLNRISFIIT